jgi:predicted P-loop ATPase
MNNGTGPDLREAERLIIEGAVLVPLKPFSKAPAGLEWNRSHAEWIDPAATGYGYPLVQNGRCSIDPDQYDRAVIGMAALGFDLDALMNCGVRTTSTRPGSGGRSMFRNDPDLRWLRFVSVGRQVILEFRANAPNLQDVVPGLVYRTKDGAQHTQTYTNGKTYSDAPEMPLALLTWWIRCSNDPAFYREQVRKFFEAIGEPGMQVFDARGGLGYTPSVEGVRSAYNRGRDVEAMLRSHGYTQHGQRWSPPGATGVPGIRRIPGKDDLWQSDHASDPLFGTFDAWSIHVALDHGGDAARAEEMWRKEHPEPVAVIDAFPLEVGVSIEYSRVTAKGRYRGFIESSIEQVSQCVCEDPTFPWIVGQDEFLQETVIQVRGRPQSLCRIEDAHRVEMRRWFDRQRWEPVSSAAMADAITSAASYRKTDCAIEWANGLEWDGQDRYAECLRRMGLSLSPYYSAVIRYWWTGLAARALDPGHKVDSVIVLIGQRQGTGKTTMAERAAPTLMGKFRTYEDVMIEHLLDESKSARRLKGVLIANIDELRGVSKREHAEIKSAISKRFESYTPKYKEYRSEYGRRCMFIASSNEMTPFSDSTGNRRWYPLPIQDSIDVDWIERERDQLWAQGIADFKADGLAWQDAETLAPEVVAAYESGEDPWKDRVLDFAATSMTDGVDSVAILSTCLEIPIAQQTRQCQARISKILSENGWTKRNVRTASGRVRRWFPIDPW